MNHPETPCCWCFATFKVHAQNSRSWLKITKTMTIGKFLLLFVLLYPARLVLPFVMIWLIFLEKIRKKIKQRKRIWILISLYLSQTFAWSITFKDLAKAMFNKKKLRGKSFNIFRWETGKNTQRLGIPASTSQCSFWSRKMTNILLLKQASSTLLRAQ